MTVHELRPTSGAAESDDTTSGGTSPDSALSGSVDELWGQREQSSPEGAADRADTADGGSQDLWASVWPRVLAVLVVTSVGLPAAVASYWHLQEVAARFNPGSALAYWLPLSVDGLLAAALVVVWSRRTRGERVGAGPWAAFAFGMIVTLLANAASVVPESEWVRPGSVLASVAAWMVALFPPVAFAVSLELIAIVLRPTRAASRDITPGAALGAASAKTPATSSPRRDTANTVGGGAATGDRVAAATLSAAPQTPRPDEHRDPGRAPAAQHQPEEPEVTAPLPVLVPDLPTGADAVTEHSEYAATALSTAVRTKVGQAEALFVDAWARGNDLSLAEVDRLVDGHRTATKAKRNLRNRGILPPAEHTLNSAELTGPRSNVRASLASGSQLTGTSSSQLA
ncbi:MULTISPECIES: DUF2637 domain-containing protein [unclassified Pseudonocardia]|nr:MULTISPECIES: DUF2637 domain-containing protein [unclassified Pseudonocardia]OLL89421.1 hypothetical protein Ae331Ps2_6320 [Pseudonocardia sp. Ae331_Ps2]